MAVGSGGGWPVPGVAHLPSCEAAGTYVFVSYARADRAVVSGELDRLRALGVRAWYDDGISAGEEWPQEVAAALTGAAACVVMVSPVSVTRKTVRDEIGFALDHDKPVVAIHLVPTELPAGLELRLGQVHAIMRWQLDEPSYVRQLGRVLGPYSSGRDASAGGPGGRPAGLAGLAGAAGLAPVGQVVVGEIPREPPGYVMRDLTDRLAGAADSGAPAVCAVIGLRGAGKTQLAAAYARARVRDGWGLVGWVNAESREALLTGLARIAGRLGVADPDGDSAESARRLREYLDTMAGRGLLVLDNAEDPDLLRPFLPAAGGVQVVVTTTDRAMAELGAVVDATVFTRGESVRYLTARTELADEAGAGMVAAELGDLPLGLAQAAATIRGQHLSYQSYLRRLQRVPVSSLLSRAPGGDYPLPLASALLLSVQAAEAGDPEGLPGRLLRVMAVLSPDGVRRSLLAGLAEGDHDTCETAVDEAAGHCVTGSLLAWSASGEQVIMHRLTGRVLRERDGAAGRLAATVTEALGLIEAAQFGADQAWARREDGADLASQAEAAWDAATADGIADENLLARLIHARSWAVRQLTEAADISRAIDLGSRVLADSQRTLGPEHPCTLAAQNDLGDACGQAGRFDQAILLLQQALNGRQQVLGSEHPDTLASQHDLADIYHLAGRVDDAILLHQQELAGRLRVLGPDDRDTIESRGCLAGAYESAGRYADAIPLYERALSDLERVAGTDHPGTLNAQNNLAYAYESAGRLDKAIALYEQNLATKLRVTGPDHPDTLTGRNNLAYAYNSAGRHAEAIALFEQNLADFERILGPDHPHTLYARGNLAIGYESANRAREAISILEQTAADFDRLLGTDHPDTLKSRNFLAHARESAGLISEAVALYDRNLADSQRTLGPDHPDTLTAQHNLAHAYEAAGCFSDAIPLYEQVVARREQILGSDHPDTRLSRDSLNRARPRGQDS